MGLRIGIGGKREKMKKGYRLNFKNGYTFGKSMLKDFYILPFNKYRFLMFSNRFFKKKRINFRNYYYLLTSDREELFSYWRAKYLCLDYIFFHRYFCKYILSSLKDGKKSKAFKSVVGSFSLNSNSNLLDVNFIFMYNLFLFYFPIKLVTIKKRGRDITRPTFLKDEEKAVFNTIKLLILSLKRGNQGLFKGDNDNKKGCFLKRISVETHYLLRKQYEFSSLFFNTKTILRDIVRNKSWIALK